MLCLIVSSLLFSLSCQRQTCVPEAVSVIPKPLVTESGSGCYLVGPKTRILVSTDDPNLLQHADYLADIVKKATGFRLEVGKWEPGGGKQADEGKDFMVKNAILLVVDESQDQLGDEGYDLLVEKKGIRISAKSTAGIFYGIQTILQILPTDIFNDQMISDQQWAVPAVHIIDRPRYSWRGMHLDVSRHFFPLEFVKKYIDLIAMHKMNVFHWHLTDDNGWRMEVKKYPLLTEIAAWRVDREHQHWNERTPPSPGEEATYGGYFTQEEIREVVEYARQRNIRVVPEIEMPGHSSEVFAAYPQLSCRGERLFVRPGSYWPITDIYCAGNDSVFLFLEDVLTEVMDIFPSPYIHIGGDEADKTQWERCPKCQKRMREEGLSDEHELQSYFVKRIERFLNRHGRRLIGWDEILEGGLAPEATVMSWRGFEGGIEAASKGHEVIMCPVSHCYLDYYQADPEFQPPSIGGLITLKKVYSFEPTPPVLTGEQARYILGGQGNLWAEFIATPEHAEYMALPRMTALSEVLWSSREQRDWDDFNQRLQRQFLRLERMGAHYSRGSYAVQIRTSLDSTSGRILAHLSSEQFDPEIRYTLDGTIPSKNSLLYTSPFPVDTSVIIHAVVFKGDSLMERPAEKSVIVHKAIGKATQLRTPPNYRYPPLTPNPLTDGLRGSDRFNDGYWQGFHGDDLDMTIDLGKVETVHRVSSGFLQHQWSWIFFPVKVIVSLSEDRQSWREMEMVNTVSPKEGGVVLKDFVAEPGGSPARYIRVHAVNRGVCPEWHPGAGDPAWIFTDEIIVN